MKTRFLRRAAALLPALALVCSLLTLPAAAASIGDNFTLEVGKSQTLELSGLTEPIRWDFDDRYVTVENAVVTAKAAGITQITAIGAASGEIAYCEVTVVPVPKPATEVRLSDSVLRKVEGDPSVTLTAAVTPADSTDKVVFTSGDDSVVKVTNHSNNSAVLEFKKASASPVEITAAAGSVTASCYVWVSARPLVSAVKVSPRDISLPKGERTTLTATVEGAASDKTVVWSSSDSGSVYVAPSTGQIQVSPDAQVGDKVTITAKANADPRESDFCVVTVIDPLTPRVTSVSITNPSTDLYRYVDPGRTLELNAAAYPLNALEGDRRIEWSSDDPSVARVDQSTGVVTGVAPGEATITARAAGDRSKTDVRIIETSGILLSYIERSPSGGKGTTVELNENSVVPIYQYWDITASWKLYGTAKNKAITWNSSNNSVAQVLSGRVTANYPGEATITATVDGTGFSASFKVKVSEDVADAVSVDMGSSPTYSFSDLLSELDKRSQSKTGAPLESIYNLKVSTENGVLYYKYASPSAPGHGVGGTERYYYQAAASGQMAIRDVTFVPLPGFSGTAVIDYNGEASSGATFTGTIRVTAAASGDVAYSTQADQPVAFAAEHFSAVCQSRSGRSIGYVTFTQPASSRGTLYCNYSSNDGQFSPKVDSSTRYYAGSNPSIDSITFVPADGYTGDVSIPYRCTDSSGAAFSGTVTITVSGGDSGSAGIRDVEYYTGLNRRQDLSASDFNDACRHATGYNLERIRFDSLPSSGAGTLYLDYTGSSSTRVTTSRSYYRGSTPRISDISFVPARNYSGTVSIPFTGTNNEGDTFSGHLIIHVDDGVGTVHYSTLRNRAVTFSAADFNDACRSVNGTTLNYVRFTGLPSSGSGTLYYNYVNANSTGSRVSTGTDYRRSGSPSLSNVTFVPAGGYDGTVSIPFTGYDSSGVRFDGAVTVAVGSGSRIISYRTASNGSVRFSASDFNSACRSATGDTLNYVRFDLPASRYGRLYHQYNSSSRTGNSVSSGTSYYYSGSPRLIGDVSFAASSTTGTVTFGYTGYSTRGDSFSGTVEVQITGTESVVSTIRYSGSSAPIHFRSSDFQAACQAALGTGLSYVQFNSLPAAGRLYQNYSGPARTGTGVTAAARYGLQDLDQISYVPKAEYQGTLTIPYTAYDAQGASYSSAVEIQLSNSYCAASFTDTAYGWDWAKPSIEYLRQSGITSGYRDGAFRPGQSISRGEFTLMICRAFQFSAAGSSGFPDVPAGSAYAGAVAAARDLGIVQGNNGRFQPDQPITRQSAMTMICRALNAAGQSVPAADSSLLSSYADGAQVSAYARSSVASLIQMGAVRGNSAMRLNPGAPISRAEMAVILHRVLTR